jgi:hypothetical protein
MELVTPPQVQSHAATPAAAAATQQLQQQPTSSSSSNKKHCISQHICQHRDSSNAGSDCDSSSSNSSSSSSGEHLSAQSARCFDAITLNCLLLVLLPAHVYEERFPGSTRSIATVVARAATRHCQ